MRTAASIPESPQILSAALLSTRGVAAGARSPKADAIEQLVPVVFVDDFLPYFRGIAPGVHRALICRGPNGTPNVGPELHQIHSSHADLWAFSEWMRTQILNVR